MNPHYKCFLVSSYAQMEALIEEYENARSIFEKGHTFLKGKVLRETYYFK